MQTHRPLILISNDDGVRAEGLDLLVKTVMPLADVIVLAPEIQQSGKSSSITSSVTLELRCVEKRTGLEIYALNGTPVDCIKMAFYSVCKDRRPDLILSGINKGTNSGINVVYSGTMGAAIEGCINGLPSVGFSQCFAPDVPVDYKHGLPLVRDLVADLLEHRLELPFGVCLNVNFPVGEINGLKWCRQAKSKWVREFNFVGENAENGCLQFELGGEYVCLEPDAEDTDEYALNHHLASCVPLSVDMTDSQLLIRNNKN